MTVLCDTQIRELVGIEPFAETIEISNSTPLPARIYANEGIAQMIFLKADRICAVSYADKGGKYQDQAGLTLPRVDGVSPTHSS